jgi:chromosome segregation ATPase
MTKLAQHRKGLILGLVAALLALPVLAADKPGKDQTRRLEQQLRAAQQEKNRLTQEKTDTENKLKDVEGKVTEAEKRAEGASARSARLNKELDAAKADIATDKAEKEALAAKLAESERKVTELRNEKQRVEVALAGHKKALGDCQARNARMYDLGNELLDKYEKKGCLDSALQAEPFTRLKRAQIEKMVEEDRERLDNEQLLPPRGAGAAESAR